MENPLLSVIVPCYNVIDYIDCCVQSLVKQSYSNIEIILINDGSSDGTEVKCAEWASVDPRIIVVNQENKGHTIARLQGLSRAKGDYVTFVDSDDFIHPQMYELLMSIFIKEEVEIVQCGVCDVYESNNKLLYKHRKTENILNDYKIYTKKEGVLNILDDSDWQSYLCNKIYKKNVLDGIGWPIGRVLDEDTSVMYEIYQKAMNSAYLYSELYYYRHRENSICTAKETIKLAKNFYDRCEARWEKYLFTENHPEYSSKLNKMKNIYLSVSLSTLRFIVIHKSLFPQNYEKIILDRIKREKVLSITFLPDLFSRLKRIELFMVRHCFMLYKFSIRIVSRL